MPSDRFLPLEGIQLDVADAYMKPTFARFIKNLVYAPTDTSQVGGQKGSQSGMFKTIESVQVYDDQFSLPVGYNHYNGGLISPQTNEAFFWNYNNNQSHGLYKINGETRNIDTVYLKSCLDLKLQPEHFIHEGGATLEVFKFTDPNTGQPRQRSYLMWTNGIDDLRFLCVEDAMATNSFDATQYPYFVGNYDPCLLINAGVPTPLDCVTITEVKNDDQSKPNNLRFKTWQFRVTFIDVYGRPSEHGIITDLYVPGSNDCISSSELLSRCLELSIKIDNPLIDKIQIEFRNCNDTQWYLDTVLFLYDGSNLGDWWLRGRNSNVTYNAETKQVIYRFCKDKECNPIDQVETTRTQNPIPRITQSVSKIGSVMGASNNKDGFNPLGKEVMDYVSVEILPPTDDVADEVRLIEIFVPIWNVYIQTQQPVYQLPNSEQWVWGGRKDYSDDYVNGIVDKYQMYFGDLGRKGFIGYLAATGVPPISTVSELYYVNDSNEMVKVEDFSIIHQPTNSIDNNVIPVKEYKRKYFLKFTFSNVLPSKYIFRIAAHTAKLTDTNFYETSTYVAGQYSWNNKSVDFYNRTNVAKELIVDVCSENYNSLDDTKVLVIWDMTEPRNTGTSRSKIVAGYIYEQKNNDVYQSPIELLNTNIYGDDNRNGNITDHNGFYFGSVRKDNGFDCEIFGFCSCVYKSLIKFRVESNFDGLITKTFDMEGSTESSCQTYPNDTCNRIHISGKVTECDSGIGIPGVGVVLSRGRFAITNANGEFTLIAHDDAYDSTRVRTDYLYYNPIRCPLKDCDSNCIEPFLVTIYPCTSCNDREIVASERKVFFETKRGLLSGGNYGIGLTLHDWLGRHTFVQTKDSLYFDMPTIIQKNTINPSPVLLKINPNATFPSWVKKITPYITTELSLSDYISWIADNVEFIDNGGNINNDAPTQIKIYYASLNEYNIQNNFNTTTHWQFIVQDENGVQTNYTSDYVDFFINGDGTYFPKLVRALIKYDQTGQYFLIDYDTDLKDLKPYALMRLSRPNTCATRDVFYELCVSIDVVNGKAQQSEIVLPAFDTYYKYRQIPIPIQTDPDTTQNIIRTFGFPFEHNSPSDFWGEKCINIGRVNSRNPYEAEIISENQIALTGGLSVNGQLNYLNYFDDAQKRNFDNWDFGGITSVLPQPGLLLVICQLDCFTVGFNDNILRTDDNGQIIVPSAANKFGNPQTKIGNNYGCILFDKNTIASREGLVQYLCSQKAYLIQHNYDNPEPVSANQIDSWLRPKVKYVQEWNRSHDNKKYFTGGINPTANGYILSDFTIGSDEFVNNEREYNIEKQEGILFDIYKKTFREWLAPTPQGWIYLDSDLLEKQLFSFAKNNCYYHYTTSGTKSYGKIYGESVNRMVRFVAVLDPMKKKQPLSLANYCVQSKYFADQILTDGNQISRIMLDYFRQGDYFSAAPFLCNINTLSDPNLKNQTDDNKIVNGDKLLGSIIDVRLIGDPSKDEVYSEYLGSTVEVFGETNSGT